MPNEIAPLYLSEAAAGFRALKKQADGALAQLREEELFARLDPESNSVAVIMRHMSGNMLSRWTDFLTTDGEKPDRDRDGEFEDPRRATRSVVEAEWEDGWQCLMRAIGELRPDDLERTVHIRGEPHTVLSAIERATRHYATHIGQILLLAKHARGADWRTLSIPRGQSKSFGGPRRA